MRLIDSERLKTVIESNFAHPEAITEIIDIQPTVPQFGEMPIDEIISIFQRDNDLLLFNHSTGEDEPLELQNDMNQETYRANEAAIKILRQLKNEPPKEGDNNEPID